MDLMLNCAATLNNYMRNIWLLRMMQPLLANASPLKPTRNLLIIILGFIRLLPALPKPNVIKTRRQRLFQSKRNRVSRAPRKFQIVE